MPWRSKSSFSRRQDDYDDYYPHSEPIRPADGIKPKSERGAFGATNDPGELFELVLAALGKAG